MQKYKKAVQKLALNTACTLHSKQQFFFFFQVYQDQTALYKCSSILHQLKRNGVELDDKND